MFSDFHKKILLNAIWLFDKYLLIQGIQTTAQEWSGLNPKWYESASAQLTHSAKGHRSPARMSVAE